MLKPRAEFPPKDGKTKVKAPREIGSQFTRRKVQVDMALGGAAQDKFKAGVASGKLKKGTASYKKSEKAAKAEFRKNFSATMNVMDGAKPKAKYTPKEQRKNAAAAAEKLMARGRGQLGQRGRALFKNIITVGETEGVARYGKKGYAKLVKLATRTDRGGGKVRKTNRRAFQTTQAVTQVTTRGGKKTATTYKDGLRAVKYFDASKPVPKEFKGAVRQYLAQKKGSWKGASAPMLGEDGYIGFKGKPTARGKGGKTQSTSNRSFQKKATAKKAPVKKAETAKPKKEAPAKKAPAAKKETPAKKEAPAKPATPRITAEANRLLKNKEARDAAKAKATPAPKPAAPKPAAPKAAPKPAAPKQFTQIPKKDSGTPERKKFLEGQLAERASLEKKIKESKGPVSEADRRNFSLLTRLSGDFKKELDTFKNKPKKKKG